MATSSLKSSNTGSGGGAVATVPPDESSENVQRGEVDMAIVCGSTIWMVTYACGFCLVSGNTLTGWDVKTATANRGHRRGCLHCDRNWHREHMAAVVVHVVMDGESCSFYSHWPLSDYVRTNWPEVYHKACHWRHRAHDVVLEVRPLDT